MAYGFRYPQEKASIACVKSFNRDRRMAPSQTPCRTWPVNELKKAGILAPGCCLPKGEYPLVATNGERLEMNTLSLSVMSWHGISDWFAPPLLSRPTTPLLVVDPCDQ